MSENLEGLGLLLAAGDTVEKVHQAAWYALLKHSDFLVGLGLGGPESREVIWEPDGGLFDLRVDAGGKSAWIELKVDSGLGDTQLRRQLEKRNAGAEVVHALLGFADVWSRPWAAETIVEHKGWLFDAASTTKELRRVHDSGAATSAARQLANAYANLLDKLRLRGRDFHKTQRWWCAHYYYLFDLLRKECPDMSRAIITYVPNRSGGFGACHWGWAKAGDGVESYLQWEDDGDGRPRDQ